MSSSITQSVNQLSYSKALIVSVFIGFFYYKFLGYDDGSALENQIKQMQVDVQIEEEKKKETDRVLAEEVEIKKQVGALSEKFKEVTQKFPVNLKSDEIISTLNSIASSTNVRVVSVKKEGVLAQELYEEVPVSVELSGTFNNIVHLMYKTAILERVTNLGDFEFSNPGNEYNGTLKMVTKIIGYKYRAPIEKESDKQEAQPAAGGA